MSAFATPFINPSATNNGTGPNIPIEKVLTYESFDKPGGRADLGSTYTYHIVFTIEQEGSTPSKLTWTFPDSADRDAEVLLVDNTVSKVVA